MSQYDSAQACLTEREKIQAQLSFILNPSQWQKEKVQDGEKANSVGMQRLFHNSVFPERGKTPEHLELKDLNA